MNLLFDFTVDKETSTIHITREFQAGLDLVWDAFTKAEILDQWMGPRPMKVVTKEMDFRVGGRWLYTMVPTDNPARYSMAEFIEIHPKTSFTTRNSFTDENGNHIPTGFTYSITTNSFAADGDRTTVRIAKKMASLAELEQFIAGGYYKAGMTMVMSNLDEYLAGVEENK